jgi:AcrR family transcriptional regulator
MVSRILGVTARLLGEVGYDRLTTNQIAAEAGIGIATLYRYFADKSDLVAALRDQAQEEISARLSVAVTQTLQLEVRPGVELLLGELTAAIADHAPLMRALVEQVPFGAQSNVLPAVERDLFVLGRAYSIRHHRAPETAPIDDYVFISMGIVLSAALRIALRRPTGSSRDDLVKTAALLISSGLESVYGP